MGEDDTIVYGNLEQALPSQKIVGLEVQILSGNIEDGFRKTENRTTVKKVRTSSSAQRHKLNF